MVKIIGQEVVTTMVLVRKMKLFSTVHIASRFDGSTLQIGEPAI
jgi:hypothetical protein